MKDITDQLRALRRLADSPAMISEPAMHGMLRAAADTIERQHAALRVAARMIDGYGDTDLHEEATSVLAERDPIAAERGDDPSDDDYAEAFMRAVEREREADDGVS